MARQKLQLAYITNDADRKASFRKRKKGLMKKVEELSILCGVDACVIVYSPFDNEPEVWPPVPEQFHRVLSRFSGLSEVEQSRKMVNQEEFTKQRIRKAHEQLKKLQRENRQKEVTHFMHRCLAGERLQNFSPHDLTDMAWVINYTMKEIDHRMEFLRKERTPQAHPNRPPIHEGNGKQIMVEPEMPVNEMPNLAWAKNDQQPGYGAFGLDDSFFPFLFNSDGAGPSMSFP